MAAIDVDGGQLNVTQSGAGPAVLCVHGLGSSGAMWQPLAAALGERYATIAVDCRGHGGSSDTGSLAVDATADDLAAVIGALGLETFSLVGASWGAQAAALLAARLAGRVNALVMVGGVLAGGANLEDEVYGIREAAHYLTDEDFGLQTGEALLSPDASEEMIAALAADMTHLGRRRYLEGLESFAASDLNAVAGAITAPTLVLRGELDDLITAEDADALAGTISGAVQGVIAGGGHFACLDSTDEFNRAVADFLDTRVR